MLIAALGLRGVGRGKLPQQPSELFDALNASPAEKCVKPKSLTSRLDSVPLPPPGGPNMRALKAFAAMLFCGLVPSWPPQEIGVVQRFRSDSCGLSAYHGDPRYSIHAMQMLKAVVCKS